MSKITIVEYNYVASPHGLTAQLAQEPANNSDGNPVEFTGTAGVSKPFGPNTTMIRICADADCSVLIGTEDEATNVPTDFALVPSKVPEWRAVKPGQFLGVIAYS